MWTRLMSDGPHLTHSSWPLLHLTFPPHKLTSHKRLSFTPTWPFLHPNLLSAVRHQAALVFPISISMQRPITAIWTRGTGRDPPYHRCHQMKGWEQHSDPGWWGRGAEGFRYLNWSEALNYRWCQTLSDAGILCKYLTHVCFPHLKKYMYLMNNDIFLQRLICWPLAVFIFRLLSLIKF